MHPRPALRFPAGFVPGILSGMAGVLLLASCARLPNAPDGAGAGAVAATAHRARQAVGQDYAPGRVIVRLRPNFSGPEIAASYASSVLGSVPELNIVLLRIPAGSSEEAFVLALQSDARVLFAEVDRLAQTAEGRQSTMAFSEALRTWSHVVDQGALERIGAGEAQAMASGRGVLVAVLDTGVDLDHPALAARLDLPGIEPGVTVSTADDRPEGVDSNGDGFTDGALGHGTHVAGIVLAVAPEARVLPVRVLDSDGVGFAFAITRGLVLATNRGVRIANLSLGMPVASQAVAAAVSYAHAAGVVVVAPAGNAASGQVEFPASLHPVIAVAGTDLDDRKAWFSNFGAGTDLCAPAVGILSTFAGGGYASWSGTSMAAPFVSGVTALLYERAGPRGSGNAALAASTLQAGAVHLGATDPVYGAQLGWGRVSADHSLSALLGAAGDDVVRVDAPRPGQR